MALNWELNILFYPEVGRNQGWERIWGLGVSNAASRPLRVPVDPEILGLGLGLRLALVQGLRSQCLDMKCFTVVFVRVNLEC